MPKYNLGYLKSKEFFKNCGELEIEGKKVIWDKDNYLAYIEVEDLKELERIHDKLKKEYTRFKYVYYYIPKENKVKVFKRGYSVPFTYSDKIKKDDVKISKKDKLNKFSPENLNILFDIKDVMDKFYNDLWKIRLKMAKSIKEKIKDKEKLLVVQHFIDRLVFLYFLCQLGIVKIKYKSNGEFCEYIMNKETTKVVFEFLVDNLNDSDIQKLLNNIFFEGLGNENKVNSNGYVNVHVKVGNGEFNISVPYLNGGLFREREIETLKGSKIKESNIKFDGVKKLIELLNRYNWIIGDYSDDEESVLNLTPEVLGHVYEKFVVGLENIGEEIKLDELEFDKDGIRYGRKKIGAYYTPEEITSYICENTIIPYLFDKLGIKYDETLNPRAAFDEFVENTAKDELEKALEVLDNIKVLDPACGSGHFLVSAGYLIYDLKEAIYNKLNKDFDEYKVVKKIILNNLYGVDISEPAVEIAKLRLWLWLVSKLKDKDSIEPLPNLEYNLRCGNSLIGWVDEPIIYTLNYAYNDRIDGIFKGLIAFSKNIKERKDLKKARDLLKSKEGNILDKYVEAFYILYKIYRECSGDKTIQLKETFEEIRSSIYESVNSAFLRYINEKIKPNYNLKKPPVNKEDFEKLNPFHWRVDFGWIIKKGGFDVVIGNPPYGNLLSNSEKSIVRNIYRSDTSEIAGLFV
ncbi:Eco57I restriction-modification methylase domain-containing protein, partial [Methanocaldococcus sp.]